MKQQTKLVVYLTFMSLFITGVLFVSKSEGHSTCPVCNHSIAFEGIVKTNLVKNNNNK